MRLADIDSLQSDLWRSLGEPAEALDASDAVTWSGTAVEDPPDSVEAPGTELSYEEPVHRLLFRRASQPSSLPRGSRLRWRDAIWTVDETFRRADHVLAVTVTYLEPVIPTPRPFTGRRPWSDGWSTAFGPLTAEGG